MEFYEKMQDLRKQKHLTQEGLASALFVSRTAISKWESGRGYPNIDSLKAIAAFFGVTVDELLSGGEVLTIAQEEHRQTKHRFCDLFFGLLDISAAMFLFLPFFGQTVDGVVQEVSLLSLTAVQPYMLTAYYAAVISLTVLGVLTLALQNITAPHWTNSKHVISLVLNAVGVLLFILSPQPYAAAFLFVFLIFKTFILLKHR